MLHPFCKGLSSFLEQAFNGGIATAPTQAYLLRGDMIARDSPRHYLLSVKGALKLCMRMGDPEVALERKGAVPCFAAKFVWMIVILCMLSRSSGQKDA